jgi:hypothetical protein
MDGKSAAAGVDHVEVAVSHVLLAPEAGLEDQRFVHLEEKGNAVDIEDILGKGRQLKS